MENIVYGVAAILLVSVIVAAALLLGRPFATLHTAVKALESAPLQRVEISAKNDACSKGRLSNKKIEILYIRRVIHKKTEEWISYSVRGFSGGHQLRFWKGEFRCAFEANRNNDLTPVDLDTADQELAHLIYHAVVDVMKEEPPYKEQATLPV